MAIFGKLTEKPLFEVSSRRNHSTLRGAKSPSNRRIYMHFSMTCFVSSVHILTCSRRISFTTAFSFSSYGAPVLSASHRLSHANCTAGRKLETEVSVNSCLVALIATESVSIDTANTKTQTVRDMDQQMVQCGILNGVPESNVPTQIDLPELWK